MIEVSGEVTIIQGNTIRFKAKNHVTRQLARCLIRTLLLQGQTAHSDAGYTCWYWMPGAKPFISLGSGNQVASFEVSTMATFKCNMPQALQSATWDYAAASYIVRYNGAISGASLSAAFGVASLTEMALLGMGTNFPTTFRWGCLGYCAREGAATGIIAYLSAGGTSPDFDPASIDVTKDLAIEWKIQFNMV